MTLSWCDVTATLLFQTALQQLLQLLLVACKVSGHISDSVLTCGSKRETIVVVCPAAAPSSLPGDEGVR